MPDAKPLTIALIVGSLRKDSLNKRLAGALEKLAPDHIRFDHIDISDLPLYNQDDDKNQAAPVKRIKKQIEEADALLFVTPEYNRSVPGVLKNAIDHASRPFGKSSWGGKRGAVIGISPGATGTAMSQQHLRNILAAVDVYLFCLPEAFLQMREGLFTDDGEIGEGSHAYLKGWMDKFVGWVESSGQ